MKTVLAVDMGGTKTATALVSDTGEVREQRKQAAGRSLDESVSQIEDAYRQSAEPPDAVGVIVPGIYDSRTGCAWCPNLWGTDDVPLHAALEDCIGVPVMVDCDRSGYVLGETWLGAAHGLHDVVYVAIGTGIGVGILSDGRVVRGAHGVAGSAGWMAVGGEWRDEYARRGGWESESAGPAVAAAYGAKDAEHVVEAARSGDERARDVLEHAARMAGRGVANLISVLNPEMVVLGGGFLKGAREWMLPMIRSEALRWAQPVSARRCRVEMSELGDDAGLLGAARLALGDF